MSTIKNWSTTAGNNNSASPDGFPENMAPSGVNDSAREVMASVRAQWEQAEWFDYGDAVARNSGTVLSLTGTHTATYAIGRRLRLRNQGGSTMYGTISDVTLTGAATQVTVAVDSGSLTGTASGVALGILAPSSDSLPNPVALADGAVGTPSLVHRGDADTGIYFPAANQMAVAVQGAQAQSWDADGHVTKPLQSSFCARVGATVTNVTGDGTQYTIAFGAEEWDSNADFNTGTYTFTAPVAGRYLFTAGIALDDVGAAHTSGEARLVVSGDTWYQNLHDMGNVFNPNGNLYLNVVAIVNMAASDTATLGIQVSNGTKIVDVLGATYPYTWFSGELLG